MQSCAGLSDKLLLVILKHRLDCNKLGSKLGSQIFSAGNRTTSNTCPTRDTQITPIIGMVTKPGGPMRIGTQELQLNHISQGDRSMTKATNMVISSADTRTNSRSISTTRHFDDTTGLKDRPH